MKDSLFLWLLLAIFTSVDSQDRQWLTDVPSDKLFLHTDRNLYYPGDTLFFQIYIENRFTRKYETNSHSLWILLTSPEGEIIDSARFRIKFSQAPGWLVIPDNCKPGLYRLNAFTSLMQNYDPSWAWSMWVKVEKPAGEQITKETSIEIPRYSEKPNISFLPESGYLISAYRQRIIYNAFSQQGRQLYLHGVIKDDQGHVIDSICSGELGPGMIEFAPESGMKYYAEFNEYPGEHFCLPAVTDDHPSIRVDKGEGCLLVGIRDNAPDEKYYLTFSKDYNIVAFAELNPGNQQKKVKFHTDSLLRGMARITLSDSMLRPLAERCVFISRDSVPGFIVTPEFEYYLPAQQAELQIGITKNKMKNVSGIFSVAVVDSSYGISPHLALRNIEDEFLFEKEFYERIPNHIKRKGLSSLNAEELDLILLTYGWSRYKRSYPMKEQQVNMDDYDRYYIDVTYQGSSAGGRNKIPKENPVFILAPEEQIVIPLNTSGKNSYFLETDSLPLSVNNIMIVTNHSVPDKIKARFRPVVNSPYFDTLGKSIEPPELYSSNIVRATNDHELGIDSIIIIKGINVYAKRTPARKYVNEYERRYQNLSTRTIDGLAIETAMTFEDMLRRLNPMHLNTVKKSIHFRPTGRIGADPPPALFVLNGIPQETSYSYLIDLKPEDIHSVTALIGTGGFFIYGEDAIGGVVFIETKLNNPGSMNGIIKEAAGSGGDLRKIIQLFRPEKEFYNPPKEVMENEPEYWIRPTLYWHPEVFYDGQNPVKIQFTNHRKKGTVYIIANGVTINGEPVFGVSKYKIK